MIFTNRYLATSASLAAGRSHGQALSGYLGQRPDAAYLSSRVWSWPRVITVGVLLLACLGSARGAISTWDNGGGDATWNTAANWDPDGIPPATNDVIIDLSGASVSLTNSVTNLSLTLGGTSAGARTLVFSNWDTSLTTVSNVTVMTNGVITLPGTFTNTAMSNRIYILCSNLTIDAGGSINVDAKGYAGGQVAFSTGNGPGPGIYHISGCSGGGYGGNGGYGYSTTTGGPPYGLADMPLEPGSGGGTRAYPGGIGGAGGGAIRINASGTVTNNGTITANGGTGEWDYGGGGSGGAIYIDCDKLVGTNGILRAIGGNGGSGSGGGGGGRIAVIYNQAAQSNEPVPDIRFSAVGGTPTSSKCGDIGTLYFPDSRFLTENIRHSGKWIMPGFTNWSPDNLMLSNVWIRFPADGFRLTVTNDVTINGSTGRLDLGNILFTRAASYSGSTNPPVLEVGGNLTLTNSARLYVYSGMTNVSSTNYGALVSVTNDLYIGTNCWIYPYSHITNGGSALFRMRDLFISTNAGFNADNKGYFSGIYSVGRGPGGGGYGGSGHSGGGYGGKGGDGYSTSGGPSYGSSNAPTQPGSGGGGGPPQDAFGHGGGLVRINASGTVTVNGTITANGGTGSWNYGGGGSGGGIYITCRTFCGVTNGILSANGGGGGSASGGGGGGRIAVFRVFNRSSGVISNYVDGGDGPGTGEDGDPGTIVWGWIPPARTVIRLY